MIVATLELPPEQVAAVGISQLDGVDMLMAAVAAWLGEAIQAETAARELTRSELGRLAQQFASGQHVVYLTLHTEPLTAVQTKKRSRLLTRRRRD